MYFIANTMVIKVMSSVGMLTQEVVRLKFMRIPLKSDITVSLRDFSMLFLVQETPRVDLVELPFEPAS